MAEVTGRRVRLDTLRPHPDNYNQHDEQQIAGPGGLMDSLRLFGQVQAIVVWRNFLVAGHGVTEAARRLGWTELDARVIPEGWPAERVKAYLAADNEQSRQSAPDLAQLALLTGGLDGDLAMTAAGGVDALAELMALTAETRLSAPKPDIGGGMGKAQRDQVIKLALYAPQMGVIEEAISQAARALGKENRGEALAEVARRYLESAGGAVAAGPAGLEALLAP